MSVIEQFGLRHDPFGPASGVSGCGVALSMLEVAERLVAAVRRGDPLIVLVGRPGMGKTLLLSRLEQICRGDGLEVCSIARGDMAHQAFETTAQLLIIDEADTINAATMRALAPGAPGATARTMVVAATRPDLHRIAGDVVATIINLKPLDPLEAHHFLAARAEVAGRPDLFAPDALDVIVEAGRGSPRLLRVLAGAAMFQAAVDEATQITAAHASLAATMHRSLIGRPEPEIRLPVAANDVVPFVRPAEGGHPSDNVVPLAPRAAPARRRVGLIPLAASVALAALIMPSFLAPSLDDQPFAPSGQAQAAGPAAGPVRLAAAAFTVAPANAAVRSGTRGGPAWAPPLRLAAAPTVAASLPVAREAARTVTASIDAGALQGPQLADLGDIPTSIAIHHPRLDAMNGNARTLVTELLAAARVRPAGVSQRGGRDGRSADDGSGDRAQLAATLAAVPADSPAPVMLATPVSIATNLSQALFDQPLRTVGAAPLRTASLSVGSLGSSGPTIAGAPPVQPARVATAAASTAREATGQAQSAKEGAGEARSAKLASDQAKATKDAAKQAAAEAKEAKDSAEQAKSAKDAAAQMKSVKQTADQGKAAKDAAKEAKAAKDASDQAKAVKQAAEQAKAAKEAADQAKAAKEAADQAKAAKDAAEAAKSAKAAADQAKAAKEAAEAAKSAKEAADQAKAAKEAADQAKAAKEAADQAKAAKEAADQAKAAKEAADQAKAAKEAADQAKAAKEAAEQAQAAKEAADLARNAKDAADQAKAAKEAADVAKDAKDSVDQARAATEAAKAAKDAAKDAAKAAKDAARAAKEAKEVSKSGRGG